MVNQAIKLAQAAGLSELFIGLTIVAVGTSLPELATSLVAARKGQSDLAIGNVVGSNIFNIFWILGITAIVRPIPIAASFYFDFWVCLGVTFLLFMVMFIGRKHELTKFEGILFVMIYIIYIIYLIYRG